MLVIAGAGPERAPEITVDAYVALTMDWPRSQPGGALWWRFVGERTMLETAFDLRSAELVHVALVQTGPVARVDGLPPSTASASPGLPRCDPAEWARRSRRGSVAKFADHYVEDADPLRTELGPGHLLVRMGEDDEPAARELVCGRARFGISAGDALLWICVSGFSDEERRCLRSTPRTRCCRPASFPRRRRPRARRRGGRGGSAVRGAGSRHPSTPPQRIPHRLPVTWYSILSGL
jgi:hypothetical protein